MRERKRRRDELIDQHREEKPSPFSMIPGAQGGKFPIDPLILVAAIGIPSNDDVQYSQELVKEIPADLLNAARDAYSARCLVFASLLDDNPVVGRPQMELIRKRESFGTLEATMKLKPQMERLDSHLRLPLFEIVQGTLSAISAQQYPVFRQTVLELILADQQVNLFEFFLQHHLIVHLDRCFGNKMPGKIRFHKLEPIKQDIGRVISILAQVGQNKPEEQQAVYRLAMGTLFSTDLDSAYQPEWDARELSQSLKRLSEASPPMKKRILTAAVNAVTHDDVLTVMEVELFRAMSEAIDCPVPPLAPTRRKIVEFADAEIVTGQNTTG